MPNPTDIASNQEAISERLHAIIPHTLLLSPDERLRLIGTLDQLPPLRCLRLLQILEKFEKILEKLNR